MSDDLDSLESLYTIYYRALDAITQYTWALPYPSTPPRDEPQELQQARSIANEYDQRIRRRLQEIKDRVTTPLPFRP